MSQHIRLCLPSPRAPSLDGKHKDISWEVTAVVCGIVHSLLGPTGPPGSEVGSG